jgi:hypothetical protein
MSPRSRIRAKEKIAPERRWRVSIIRSRGQLLGFVKAPSREAAEAAAAQMFELGDEQRRRLMVQEGGW